MFGKKTRIAGIAQGGGGGGMAGGGGCEYPNPFQKGEAQS